MTSPAVVTPLQDDPDANNELKGTDYWTPDDQAQYEFYEAANESRRQQGLGMTDLQILMEKGLTSKKLPKELRGQRAANAFQSAFELIGGVPRLALWADKNPTAFFSLYSKLIPATVKAEVDHKLEVTLKYSNPNFNQPHTQVIEDVTPKDDNA